MGAECAADGPGARRPGRRVGIVVHGGRPGARAAADAAVEVLDKLGAEVAGCAADGWAGAADLRAPENFGHGLDAVVVLGGDGTFLRAAHMVRDAGVPLLGVNLGRLGFFSEVEEAEVDAALGRIVAGDYALEERMTLAVEVRDATGALVGSSWALNEASVERQIPQRLLELSVAIGQGTFAEVPADALICATPTGSTAYAFSAGGPIVSPLVNAILLVAVAPHTLFDRTVVVDPAESVSVTPFEGDNPCVVSLDGREPIPVPAGGTVRIVRGQRPVRMVRLEPFDFYQRVRNKFRLA